MTRFVQPETYLVGYTRPDIASLRRYLEDADCADFWASFEAAPSEGVGLLSMFAKLCYKSLRLGQNANVTRVRDCKENFESVISSGHGSVLEHFGFNFITRNCSRVFTHELVRHRVGTAFSQTSGRYVAITGGLDMVLPDFMLESDVDDSQEPGDIIDCPACTGEPDADWPKWRMDQWKGDCELCNGSLRTSPEQLMVEIADDQERHLALLRRAFLKDDMTFDRKKYVTSAIRRWAPNGQANEIAWSMNLRALRNTLGMRTSPHAEWEIRLIFNQAYDLVAAHNPTMLWAPSRMPTPQFDGLFHHEGLEV